MQRLSILFAAKLVLAAHAYQQNPGKAALGFREQKRFAQFAGNISLFDQPRQLLAKLLIQIGSGSAQQAFFIYTYNGTVGTMAGCISSNSMQFHNLVYLGESVAKLGQMN